ncbi:hypothetical protein MCEMAEM6B_02574 [Mycobacteriaceae bacterium]
MVLGSQMITLRTRIRVSVGAVAVALPLLTGVPVAPADPTETPSAESTDADSVSSTTPDGEQMVPYDVPAVVEDAPMSEACTRFTAALNLAAVNYDEFAYATAGTGNSVDYRDPNVWQSNVIGRTALREAAREALDASRTPGTPPEISGPMRSWSLGATKLLVIMGLRGGGDSLNAAATALNADAQSTQMACALDANRP